MRDKYFIKNIYGHTSEFTLSRHLSKIFSRIHNSCFANYDELSGSKIPPLESTSRTVRI